MANTQTSATAAPATELEDDAEITAFGPIIAALRDNFEQELAKMPKQHSKQTPQCVPMSRFVEVTLAGKSAFTTAEQDHLATCDFCRRNLTLFTEPSKPELPSVSAGTLPTNNGKLKLTLSPPTEAPSANEETLPAIKAEETVSIPKANAEETIDTKKKK